MFDTINNLNIWTIIKWIVIVLIAGFIGQFGKSTAQAIIAKIRIARTKREQAEETIVKNSELSWKTPSKSAEADSGITYESSESANTNRLIPDKKSAKTMAKQIKKIAKQIKKAM